MYWIIILSIKYTEGDRSGIIVEEFFLVHKGKIQVVEATERELKVHEASSQK